MTIVPFDHDQARTYQHLTAESLGIPVDERIELDSEVQLRMKLIPAGEFFKGTEADEDFHRVRITRPFYLGSYPVTQESGTMGTHITVRFDDGFRVALAT